MFAPNLLIFTILNLKNPPPKKLGAGIFGLMRNIDTNIRIFFQNTNYLRFFVSLQSTQCESLYIYNNRGGVIFAL